MVVHVRLYKDNKRKNVNNINENVKMDVWSHNKGRNKKNYFVRADIGEASIKKKL